jgi:AcrR family transcriptional regulator
MTALRSDAARSRARILEVARTHDSHDLRLNDLAREAGVGVGTVYRHFPTVQALVEALTVNTVERMLDISRRAADEPDPGAAFSFYLRSALTLQLEDGGLQSVLLSPEDETDAVRPDLTLDQLSHLVCGIEYAVRLGTPADRSPLLEIILTGLRPAA